MKTATEGATARNRSGKRTVGGMLTLERDDNLRIVISSAEGAQALRLKDRGATRYLNTLIAV